MSQGSADTIVAEATARGAAALSIVRMSGADALRVADRCFSGRVPLRDAATHTAHFGRIQARDEVLDQVVATVFRNPGSATGEDVVEFTCHGGRITSGRILEALLAAGARGARPGEFTERAFVNGKIDLVQAEATAGLIHASSIAAQRVAVRQLEGRYSEWLGTLREELLGVCGAVELELDFSEEDVAFADRSALHGLLDRTLGTVGRALADSRATRAAIDGLRVAIVGRPNAGKSSLLNALLGSDRAIVSETAGTTRDVIEADLVLDGFLFRVVDTAGLRATADAVETEGVRRADSEAERADVVLYLFDLEVGLADDEAIYVDRLRSLAGERAVILVGNKADTLTKQGNKNPADVVMSALEALSDDRALDSLLRVLRKSVDSLVSLADASPGHVNARHRQHLENTHSALQRAQEGLSDGITGDLLAQDLRIALSEIGQITGEVTNEDVLGHIFSRFCIGK